MTKSSENLRKSDKEVYDEMSRRAFLRNSALAFGGVGAAMALGGCAPSQQAPSASAADGESAEGRVVEELPIPEPKAPEKTEYEVDVLVVGGGFAGVTAAWKAKQEGKTVLVIDKGTPGYSGLMPWAHTFRWIDYDMGDDRETQMNAMIPNSEYTANPEWYGVYCDRSKEISDLYIEWGFLGRWDEPDMEKTLNENKQDNPQSDRHVYWNAVLGDNDIECLTHTMVVDVVEDDGRVVGAVAMDNETATPITVKAKATILAMGAGAYKPTGFPTGSNTFDAQGIGYRHGLMIAGKEFPDHHGTNSYAPGSTFTNWGWQYLEAEMLCGGVPGPETIPIVVLGLIASGPNRVEDGAMGMVAPEGFYGGPSEGLSADDPRIGAHTTIPQGMQNSTGGSIGMSVHKSEGIFCGNDVLDGTTPLPGLYVAGDSMASLYAGAVYGTGPGSSSSMSGVQGLVAAEAACKYISDVQQGDLPSAAVQEIVDRIEAPSKLETGFDANWARDILHATMAPYWTYFQRSESMLQAALANIEYMRDNVVPRIMAENPHEQRLALEMQNKILAAEMTLRSALERKESRGMHYRTDYPYRDDENYLCHFGLSKDDDGTMKVNRIDYPDEWKGDLSMPYQQRYPMRFPGELDALGLDPNDEPGMGTSKDWSKNARGGEE